MHVTYGLRPNAVDDDVRFRTTYFFRTFDYCWDADAQISKLGSTVPISYRQIIPQTDTLYRYRMTGKASALFSKIRFESGTLKREEIDPFGTQVTYSAEADGFLVRDRSEVKAAADNLAAKREQRERIGALLQHFGSLPETTEKDKELKAELITTISAAVKGYLEIPTLTTQEAAALKAAIDAQINALQADLTGQKALLAELSAKVVPNNVSTDTLGPCPIGQTFRKGFQIMGPEGIKTFDQNERLVMAMSSSAKPLIETLQEYSGRILNTRAEMPGQLLILAQENARAEALRRQIADSRRLKQSASAVFEMVTSQAGDGK